MQFKIDVDAKKSYGRSSCFTCLVRPTDNDNVVYVEMQRSNSYPEIETLEKLLSLMYIFQT